MQLFRESICKICKTKNTYSILVNGFVCSHCGEYNTSQQTRSPFLSATNEDRQKMLIELTDNALLNESLHRDSNSYYIHLQFPCEIDHQLAHSIKQSILSYLLNTDCYTGLNVGVSETGLSVKASLTDVGRKRVVKMKKELLNNGSLIEKGCLNLPKIGCILFLFLFIFPAIIYYIWYFNN